MHNSNPDSTITSVTEEAEIFPPKFIYEEGDGRNIIYRSMISLLAYLIIGYFLFRRIDILIVLAAIMILHESGHFLAMKYFKYNDVGVFFIPLLGALISGNKREVSQQQSAVILLAGPLPGIVLGIILFLIDKNYTGITVGNIPLYFIAQLLVWFNILNLIPVYPLDGGQLLNRVFLEEEGLWSNIFIIASAAAIIWLAISIQFYVLLIFPALLLFRFLSTKKHIDLEQKISDEGIDLDISYDELSNAAYWKIRAVIVRNISAFSNVNPGPPYLYDAKEEKIMQEVEAVLQRNLLMDITLPGKLLVAAIWIIAIASPWIFGIQLSFYKLFYQYFL